MHTYRKSCGISVGFLLLEAKFRDNFLEVVGTAGWRGRVRKYIFPDLNGTTQQNIVTFNNQQDIILSALFCKQLRLGSS